MESPVENGWNVLTCAAMWAPACGIYRSRYSGSPRRTITPRGGYGEEERRRRGGEEERRLRGDLTNRLGEKKQLTSEGKWEKGFSLQILAQKCIRASIAGTDLFHLIHLHYLSVCLSYHCGSE